MTRLEAATTLEALLAATWRASLGKRRNRPASCFLMDAERDCLALQRALRLPPHTPGAWRPGSPRHIMIRDPKPRRITIAPFVDRVVHQTLCAGIAADLDRFSIYHSYACRVGKGQHRALRQAQCFARAAPWVLKGDIRAYFASVPHQRVLQLVRKVIGDDLLYMWIERALVDAVPGHAGRGLPIGSLISQHLANLYLGVLDHYVTDGLGFGRMLRYMDDFLVFGERDELVRLRQCLAGWLEDQLDLSLNQRSTRVAPVGGGIAFLGFDVFPGLIRLSPARWRRFRRQHRAREAALEMGILDEEEAAASAASQYAHLAAFDTYRVRRNLLAREREKGRGRHTRQAGHPRRLVQEHTRQRAGGEPEQGEPVEPERQPWLSYCELNHTAGPAGPAGPVAAGSWAGGLRPGVDQTLVPCLVAGRSAAPARDVTEAPPAPGGVFGVAGGPLISGGSEVR